jgi:hypothetical protein
MNENKFLSTNELEGHITGLWSKIAVAAADDGVYWPFLITFTADKGEEGRCYSDDDGYHYRYFERGILRQDEATSDLSEITFIALESSVHPLASRYECKHRIKGQDFRRLLFEKELQYFSIIGEEYKRKIEAKINKVLESVPYKDGQDG